MKKYIAEVIGTAVLVLMGCGTAMLVGCDAASGSGYLLTALAFGLTIVGMAYCVGNISGFISMNHPVESLTDYILLSALQYSSAGRHAPALKLLDQIHTELLELQKDNPGDAVSDALESQAKLYDAALSAIRSA